MTLPPFLRESGLLSGEECESLSRSDGWERQERTRHGTFGIRVWWQDLPETPWLTERLRHAFERNNPWQLDLDGSIETRLLRYEEGDFTRPHVDYDHVHEDFAKITCVCQLSAREAFDGGALEISERFRPTLERGDALFFPSFSLHRVTRLERGTRLVLTAWARGPALR